MNNKDIKDNRFYKFSSLVLSKLEDMNILERGQFSSDYDKAGPLPSSFKCIPLDDNDFSPQLVVNEFRDLCDAFKSEYNVEPKISVLYPNTGFIGWHTNANQNMFNAICTFSENGNGVFKYIDNKEIIEVKDIEGWSVKQSAWFNESIPHMAYTECNRITIAFTSSNKTDIDNFINKLT